MIQEEEGIPRDNIPKDDILKDSALQNDFAAKNYIPGVKIEKNMLLTVLVCTGISLFFTRTGFLSLFYLAPLGYAVLLSGSYIVTFVITAVINIFLGFIFINSAESGSLQWLSIFYLTSMMFCFSWFMGSKNIRSLFRIVLAGAAGAAALLFTVNNSQSNVYSGIGMMAWDFSNIFESSPHLKELFSSEAIVEMFKGFLLRGGALSCTIFLLYVNRNISYGIFYLIKKQKIDKGLDAFFAPQNTFWVLIGSLAFIITASIIRLEIIEIISWNVFVIGCIIFLAQGLGIISFWLSKRQHGLRLAANIAFIFALFSPMNVFILIGLIILGIAENFWQFRLSKGQVSTPKP